MVSHIKMVRCAKEVVSHVKLVVSHNSVMVMSYIKMEPHINHVKEMASHIKLIGLCKPPATCMFTTIVKMPSCMGKKEVK